MAVTVRARAAALPAGTRRRRPWTSVRRPDRWVLRLAFELSLILPAYLAYHLVRGLVNGRIDQAFDNAHAVIRAERALGIFWEVWLQNLVVGHQSLVSLSNSIYIYGHMPLIAVLAVWVFAFHPEAFARYRNAFLLSGAIGLVFFIVLPTAPPRLVEDAGFVDTITLYSNAYRVLQPPAFVNQYAAMPSLHFGWNLLVGLAVFQTTRAWYSRAFGLLLPFAMLASVILTGNHYILDVAAGGAIALAALWIAAAVHRILRRTRVPAFLY